MGKRSVKENKNIYQLSREAMGYTREKASEEMVFLSDDRIEKIESERTLPHPDEIVAMADCYRMPNLRNYYCSHECPIGQRDVPEIQMKDLSQIILSLLSSLNSLYKEKDRLIEIAADGRISTEEDIDFSRIRDLLSSLSLSADTLRLWVEKEMHTQHTEETDA